jgi:hypothetical protein
MHTLLPEYQENVEDDIDRPEAIFTKGGDDTSAVSDTAVGAAGDATVLRVEGGLVAADGKMFVVDLDSHRQSLVAVDKLPRASIVAEQKAASACDRRSRDC